LSFYEKPLRRTGFFLRQSGPALSSLGPPISYTLYRAAEDKTWALDAQQAEVDSRERLILTRDGKLFVVTVDTSLPFTDKPFEETELVDFNDMCFQAIPPPEWATHW